MQDPCDRAAAPLEMSAVAKRMLLHYQRGAFPAYEEADEGGMPQPCALGLPWVNPDPWGRPLPEPGK